MSEMFFTPLKGKNAYLKGWQDKELTYEEAKKYGGTGVGIVHGLSGTCCIDVDEMSIAREWFRDRAIDIEYVLDRGFRVMSPNDKSGKAIFKIPEGAELPKLTVKDDKSGIQFIEFRSGGHQDAWPGSQYHYTGKGFDEYVPGDLYTTDWKGDENDGLPDLPLDVVKLWVKLAETSSKDNPDNVSVSGGNDEDIESVIGTIISGKSGLHDAINKYAYMQVMDGIANKVIITTLQGLMMACPEEVKATGRWRDYYDDIVRSVEGVKEPNVGVVPIPDWNDDTEVFKREMPWPPGRLGDLAKNAYDMQRYQYKEVAIVSAIGVVAGIAGRKFNVSGTGLNMYLTLIMNTGMGKDSIREFVMSTINRLNNGGKASSFVGPGRFTGPKSVFSSLKAARCRVSVFTEAGLLLRSSAGDQDGLTRALLQLYSCSGQNQFSMEEVYSKAEDSVESLQAPCLTIINEATPETLLGAFKSGDSLENGHLPRQSIYRIVGDKPYMNFNVISDIDSDLKTRLKVLISKCASTQSANNPSAWNMIPEPDVVADVEVLSKYYTDIENTHRDSDIIRSIMASRCLLKALKFAGIASVMNHEDAVIRWKEWEWAKEMVDFEMAGIDNFFQGGLFNKNLDDLAYSIVGRCIVKILNGKYLDPKKQMCKKDRKEGRVSIYALRQTLRSNRRLNEIDDDPKYKSKPKSGLEKVIEYMIDNGYLKWDNSRSAKRSDKKVHNVIITNMFNKLMEN